ncbi:MAG: hypothetical protein Q8L15_18500 [Methylobacter sp.]|nr:hypothetical protein [Methylobacter sp.]
MTTINKKNVLNLVQVNAPYGNAWKQQYNFTTSSAGVFTDSDLATAVQSADVVRLGVLPAGLTLHDALVIRSDAFTASTTASIGFAYVDGVDVTAQAQDAAYFASALATDATGVTRKTGVKAPLALPKDAYLILTIGGAAHASAGVLDVVVEGIWTGLPSAIPA